MTDWESRVPPPWEPPAAGSEVEHLVGALDRQRATFRWKADGLDAAGLRTGIGSSSLTLAGLLKHLALVEDHYFGAAIPGRPLDERWPVDAMRADPDWEFVSALDNEPADLYALYDGAVMRARAALAKALADGGLDRPVDRGWPDGRMPSAAPAARPDRGVRPAHRPRRPAARDRRRPHRRGRPLAARRPHEAVVPRLTPIW